MSEKLAVVPRYLYCNAPALDILAENDITPLEQSKGITEHNELFLVIGLTDEAIEKAKAVPLQQYNERRAWLCEISGSKFEELVKKQYQPTIMRQFGLHNYIAVRFGATKPRNVAAVLGDVCSVENKTPIELFNSLRPIQKNIYDGNVSSAFGEQQ